MTLYGPFAERTPSGQIRWVSARRGPTIEHFRRILGLLDGAGRYVYSIWRSSDPTSIMVPEDAAGDSFLQAAGSANAMTVELGAAGQLFTIGRRLAAPGAAILIPISDARAVQVSPSEVFTAAEAAEIFEHYTQTDGVGEQFALRAIDLSRAQSVPR